MKALRQHLLSAIGLALAIPTTLGAASGDSAWKITIPRNASVLEHFAAREVRRYTYLRTGQMCAIAESETAPTGPAVVVARNDRELARTVAGDGAGALGDLQAQQYVLKTYSRQSAPVLLLCGGDDAATLYAAYRFAERLGVRFYLHGDVIPDERIGLQSAVVSEGKGAERLRLTQSGRAWAALPSMNETGKPLFNLRGIQPFHDFPEGPDWWNTEDYLAIMAQLPKLRMNFFGLHTYPEGRPNAEPTVWIGHPKDVKPGGEVAFSYPSSYQNTLRGNWGYRSRKTSDFFCGAAMLFEHDGFGPEVMSGMCPAPNTADDHNELFNRTAVMLKTAFEHARQLGVRTCVGTETPLVVPKLVRERLAKDGLSVTNLEVIQQLYEGIFQRAAGAYPIDYYWFWTPENWTWEGTKEDQIRATTNDIFAAISAARKVGAPFRLATCGWVLGPQQDRAMFDKVLPKDMPVSCINREVGKTPVEKGFADVKDRSKWAIPWLEDDPALTSPQLWAGRMRRDAADALRYGCDGLMGIHWRTRVLAGNVSALAQAAWEQGDWAKTVPAAPLRRLAGPVGGKPAGFPTNTIRNTQDAPLYRTVRYDLSAYHLPVKNGALTVTLQFCEPNYNAAGKRVFDVKVQGQTRIEKLDIFERVGKDCALDYTFKEVVVTNGWLDIEFVPRVEYPSIAAIAVPEANLFINCAGEAYKNYVADLPGVPGPTEAFPPTQDFYADWALANFGNEIASEAAAIFQALDGRLPRPSDWVEGPGGIRPDARPWSKVSAEYDFVDKLASLRSRVKGPGNFERFDYWVNTFRYMRAMAQVNCTWGLYNKAMERVRAESDLAKQKNLAAETALSLRRQLVEEIATVHRYLLATVSNPGELGTVANWDQHLIPDVLDKPGQELARILEAELPANARLSREYDGPTRIIVPAVRGSLFFGEDLKLKVIILSKQAVAEAGLYWRPLGKGRFSRAALEHVERGVYAARISQSAADLEYFVRVIPAEGAPVYYPPTAPDLNQTVVRFGQAGGSL